MQPGDDDDGGDKLVPVELDLEAPEIPEVAEETEEFLCVGFVGHDNDSLNF